MLKYKLTENEEKLFGYNFTLLLKLAAKTNPDQTRNGVIFLEHLEDSFFQHKGTEKRNLIIYLTDKPEIEKYIRLSYVGNYYFGFRINVIHFIKTFLAKESNKRNLSANKFMIAYIMKNYFKKKLYNDNQNYFFESRYAGHRKSRDAFILTEKKRSNHLFDTMKTFLKTEISTEKDQYELVKFFLKLRRAI